LGIAPVFILFRAVFGAGYAACYVVPKVIFKADGARRGFITAVLTPVNRKKEPPFGIRQAFWVFCLCFGTVALMRLLLAR